MSQTTKELRQFGVITGTLISAIFGLFIPWVWDITYLKWPWYLGGVLLATGLIVPSVLQPVYTVWMKLAHVLGWINTRIILGIIYYSVFLPVRLVFLIIGKDPMRRKIDKNMTTYRTKSTHLKTHDMEKPF